MSILGRDDEILKFIFSDIYGIEKGGLLILV
jgi:hypothetical protein